MRIKLLKEWDFFPKIEEQTGFFTGRKLLKERLFNEIIRRSSGAILLSGSRGVGKTALVYESLRNIRDEIRNRNIDKGIKNIKKIVTSKTKKTLNLFFFKTHLYIPHIEFDYRSKIVLLPIIINASQLDLNYATENNKTNIQLLRKEIIIQLIRGLNAAVNKIDSTKLRFINDVYKKALATEYRISQDIKRSKSVEYGFTGDIKVNFDSFVSLIISCFISVTIFLVIYSLIGTFINVTEAFRITLAIIPSIGILAATFFISKKYVKSDTEREIYIRDDNSVTNLEIMLENALEDLSKHFKPVYIIDELDYFEKTELNQGSPISIVNLIKTYKNLFNLVDAIFIFIAGHDTWTNLQESKRKDIQHTLFTSNIFLPKPEFSDIKEYIKTISPEVRRWDKKEEKLILNYLVYKAKAEYFDLKNIINSNITQYRQYPDYRPVLEIDLNNVYTRQSKIQEVIEILFNYQKFKEFEKNEENYNLLELIYKTCDLITPVESFIIAKKKRWELIVDGATVYETGDNWFKNMIYILEWLGIIENIHEQEIDLEPSTETTPDPLLQHNTYKLVTYRWTGRTPYVPTDIRKIETEEVKQFKNEFSKLNKEILSISNTLKYLSKGSRSNLRDLSLTRISKPVLETVSKLTNITLSPTYTDYYDILVALRKDVPEYIDAVDLIDTTKKIRELRNNLFQDINQMFGKMITQAAINRKYNPSLYTEYDNQQYLAPYPKIKNLLGENKSSLVINSNSTNRNLLVCTNINIAQLENAGVTTVKSKNDLRLIVINPAQSKLTRKTTQKILIEIGTPKIVEGLANTKEGRSILTKIIQFLHWQFI